MPPLTSRHRLAVLATVCLAVFAINLDTTIVNVALPDLARQLGATTRDLQWIVDGYNLAFAALVLAAGSIGDRFGRRPMLLAGLIGFAVASGVGALCTGAGALIAARFIMGAFAALIFPTTLSIITNAYPDRSERAKAIGVWGAVTGLGVAVGPVTGGLLLSHFTWPSVFVALVPVALIAAALAYVLVPESSDPDAARLDIPGLVTSSAAIGLLVYTIIEAPGRGWSSAASLAGFAGAAVLATAFVRVERRRERPMIDVSLFRTPAFSAASGAVTVAFFALFGFIFLITQFFQLLQNYGPLETGVRILPVALSIAVGSVVGTRLAVTRVGTKAVVLTGLLMLAAAFWWVARIGIDVPYLQVAAQMVLLGGGLGLTTAPATDSIMGVVRPEQAGAGSAVNDATRQVGGTLGVAVLGSIFSTLYIRHLSGSESLRHVPESARTTAQDGLAQGLQVAAQSPPPAAAGIREAVSDAFMSGLHAGCLTASAVCLAGAALVLGCLPAYPTRSDTA